ncbi:MAG: hypothetical protein ACP5OG_05475 [Candidatus Nanoarchaeia archaeon]
MKFNFNFKGKKFSLEAEECKTLFSKARGLMFRRKSKPLLFYFNKEVLEPIHSFFCKPFIAIWFNKNKIVDVKSIKKWKPYIVPRAKFDTLLEVPCCQESYSRLLVEFRKL